MLFSPQPVPKARAPPALRPISRHFPKWRGRAVLAISSESDDDVVSKVKKSPPDQAGSAPFVISNGDATARIAHLEHSVKFLQEQHRLMLSGLHAEIEALRERNRDLQFQLIFNKESSPKPNSPASEESSESNEETNLKREVTRLEREAAAARGEARAAEARALQLQRMVDAQAEKLRELELQPREEPDAEETRAELRARLAEAERLVRRLRGDAERQRREVLAPGGGGVTNLLFDGALATQAHLQCMKNSLHASLRASGLDPGFGYQNNYHFPPVHAPEFWREPLREEFSVTGAGITPGRGRARRPLTLPDLAAQPQRATVYANNHTRPRPNGYEHKNKRSQGINGDSTSSVRSPDEATENRRLDPYDPKSSHRTTDPIHTYPELKVVVTRMIPCGNVSNGHPTHHAEGGRRPRRPRRHAPDHT